MSFLIWIAIFLCLTQSAMFSGLNLAYFSVSKLRLELEAGRGNVHAHRVMALRKNANFLLATILWGNVAVNTLLAILSGSVMAGFAAFLFSTVVITVAGEIIPQAYFSRHALIVGARLAPAIRFYQIILYPIARLTALLLDHWLGEEAIHFYKEQDLRALIKLHIQNPDTEITSMEGKGALNFLDLDDIALKNEGEYIDPASIIQLSFKNGRPLFPEMNSAGWDVFLQRVLASGKKWIIIVDQRKQPVLVLNADKYLREVMLNSVNPNVLRHCHRPLLLRDPNVPLGHIVPRFKVHPEHAEDDVIDEDIILLWHFRHKKIISGSDLLGRLLRGVVLNRVISSE